MRGAVDEKLGRYSQRHLFIKSLLSLHPTCLQLPGIDLFSFHISRKRFFAQTFLRTKEKSRVTGFLGVSPLILNSSTHYKLKRDFWTQRNYRERSAIQIKSKWRWNNTNSQRLVDFSSCKFRVTMAIRMTVDLPLRDFSVPRAHVLRRQHGYTAGRLPGAALWSCVCIPQLWHSFSVGFKTI